MKKLSTIFTFDFECTSKEPATPYICSFTRLDKLSYDETISITSMNGVIDYIFSQKTRSTFYAHNLKYDISFILSYLFQYHNGEFIILKSIIMPLTKAFFSIEISFRGKVITFKDTLCLFGAPLSKVLESYTDLEKTKTPLFDYIDDVDLSPDVLRYSKIDSLGLAISLVKRFEYGEGALTTASGAFKEFKTSIINKFGKSNYNEFFPILKYDEQEEMRNAYRGGFTFLNPFYQDKIINDVDIIDVNSMYPAQLYYKPMPYGMPLVVDDGKIEIDDLYNLGIQKIVLNNASVKSDAIPFLSNTNTFMATNNYRDVISKYEDEKDRTFYLTLQELELFKKNYKYDKITYKGGWLFKSRCDLFRPYIDKFWIMKSDKNPTIKALGKLFLNALYGKFGEGYEKSEIHISYDNKLKFETLPYEIREVGYLPVAIFTTSYARCFLLDSIRELKTENFVYCDTDSIHFVNSPDTSKLEFHDKDLGKWGVKGKYKRGYYIRAKRYCGELIKGDKIELEIACAGIKRKDISEQVTKLEDFKAGKEIKTIEFKAGVNGQYTRDKFIQI